MPLDAWLPAGFRIPGHPALVRPIAEASDWQVWTAERGARLLLARAALYDRWISDRLIEPGTFVSLTVSGQDIWSFLSQAGHALSAAPEDMTGMNKQTALALALALKSTREVCPEVSFHDALYAERISRLLPTYTLTPPRPDDVVLGAWLTRGVSVSAHSGRRVESLTGWLALSDLSEIVAAAGLDSAPAAAPSASQRDSSAPALFRLAGRPMLEAFFRDHVIDIVEHADRYRALGIHFPSAIVLHGPPGCGKTFAAERLIEYLAWPSFRIEATTIGSPYIHETSRKVAAIFDDAIRHAPSVLVIDEMEAFLADRSMGASTSHHRVEEVAEFLRRIPEAVASRVLVIAMTNKIDMIDPAILRRGRFDHVLEVGGATREEVRALLQALVSELPTEGTIDLDRVAEGLVGRPLSDVAYVVREGARLAARAGKASIDAVSLQASLESTTARGTEQTKPRRGIGFARGDSQDGGNG